MSYIKETGHENIDSRAATVQPDIKPGCLGGNMKGETNMDVDISETPSNSYKKDTSIVRTTLRIKYVNTQVQLPAAPKPLNRWERLREPC